MTNEKTDIAISFAGLGMPQSTDLATTKMLAIGSLTEKGINSEIKFPIMARQLRATLQLYLAGVIHLWWSKTDLSGVVFIMDLSNTAQANQVLEKLPLALEGLISFDFIPLSAIGVGGFLSNAYPYSSGQ